jgi:hypothetical protein
MLVIGGRLKNWGQQMTIWKSGIACGFGLALTLAANSAWAVGPVNSMSPLAAVQPRLDASFFGRPYPYGYSGWGPCVRYLEVETRWGPRLRRVWVCH